MLLALDNLGFQVKTLIAGLGIGGIAVALAVQNVLGDLFASVSIALDKPFEVGDSLTLDGATRHRRGGRHQEHAAAQHAGEQIIIANAELVKARIRDQAGSPSAVRCSASWSRPAPGRGRLAAVPEIVRAAVAAQPRAPFERAHLVGFVPRGPEFEASFVVGGDDYALFLDVQQAIHLAIAAELERRGIRLAPPAPA